MLESIIGSIKPIDFIAIFSPILLALIYQFHYKKRIRQHKPSLATTIFGITSSILLFLLSQHFYRLNANYENTDNSITQKDLHRRYFYFVEDGLVTYTVEETIRLYLSRNRTLSEEETAQVSAFFNHPEPALVDSVSNADKNLILIIVESLNSWVVGKSFDGREITPTLNSLCRQSGSIVGLKMIPQIKGGRSSDGQMIYNIGLLPIKDGAAAVRFGDCDYPSLAKALNRNNSFEVICESAGLWNHAQTSVSYGYGQLYHHSHLKNAKGWGEDKALFNASKEIISTSTQPFLAELTTITMHQPYDKLKVSPTWISSLDDIDTNTRNYLEATHYFDNALGAFIRELKDMGVYDNSVIVILSDHNATDDVLIPGHSSPTGQDRYITFIAVNTGRTQNIDSVFGQIDIFPTILDIMQCDYDYRGVGHSLLRHDITSAIDAQGNVIGNTNAPEIPRQRQAWAISDMVITSRYFNTRK